MDIKGATFLIVLFLFVSCSHTEIKKAEAAVEVGMTILQIIEILGEPEGMTVSRDLTGTRTYFFNEYTVKSIDGISTQIKKADIAER